MSKKLMKKLKRIIIALCMFFIVLITNLILEKAFSDRFPNGLASIAGNKYGFFIPFALYFAIYIYIGHDVLRKSAINISHGQVFDENFLMAVATLGAFGLGLYTGFKDGKPEGFDEACAVLLFYQVGEWFQAFAAGKSRKSIKELMDIRPDYANVYQDGTLTKVDPANVSVGTIIVVKPGEKIPLDGVIVKGSTTLDTKALTGESMPQNVTIGDNVISGTVNLSSIIEIETQKEFGDSTVSKILDLVENASNEKSKSEAFITVFAKYYTPIVVTLALVLAFIPPLINGFMGNWNTFSDWIYRALSFLVVSCPCALVISVPLSFFSGLGGASKNGILIKGSIHLERFNKANIFVFDKTGTLTKGNFNVEEVEPISLKDEILRLAATAEANSNHPIAKSIVSAFDKDIDRDYEITDIQGKGVVAKKNDDVIICGNHRLMELYHIEFVKPKKCGTIVYVAHNDTYLGYILIKDEIKEEAKDTIAYLNSINAKTVMLTGDNKEIASEVSEKLGLSDYKCSLLPQNKVEEVDKLLSNKNKDEMLVFVGDGINDAPVIMKSDIGLAMGGVGSDAAIEASDIVLMKDDLSSIITCKKIAKKTMRIVYENIIFALLVKVIILILSACGITNMWFAVFGDVGVAFIAILNAMRANSKKY